MTAGTLARSPGAAGPLLADDSPDLSWQDAALCAQSDPEAWFPKKGGSVRDPKRICGRCPVRAECLEYALENCFPFGIWGATTERERRAILAGREPGVPRCESGWHPLAAPNLTEDGKCLACSEVRSVRTVQAHQETRGLAA